MSLIPCPECGTDISNKAKICPYCGYQSDNPSRPISEQDEYTEQPHFQFVFNYCDEQLCALSREDERDIYDCFSNWRFITEKMPAIAIAIKKILTKSKRLEANIDGLDDGIKELINKGIYKLQKTKDGRLLAQIVNKKNKIVKQVDLTEVDVQPDVLGAINNIQTQAQMAEILHEIKAVSEQLQELRIEINNDRLAKVDSAFELLSHANNIRSKRIRDMAIIDSMSNCLEVKHSLMRNFKNYIGFVKSNYKNSIFSKDCDQQAKDAFEALLFITRTVQLECMAYSMLGQYDICNECLERFNEFVIQNELNNRDTLILINENLKENRTDIVDQFVWISLQIESIRTTGYFPKNGKAIPLSDMSKEK